MGWVGGGSSDEGGGLRGLAGGGMIIIEEGSQKREVEYLKTGCKGFFCIHSVESNLLKYSGILWVV